MPQIRSRRGMSLIELLVVVAILGLLAVAVLPTLATTAEAGRTREAARTISAFIARSQARAMGRREWSGFWIIPASGISSAGVDLMFADVPEVYRGDTLDATVRVASSGSPTRGLTFPEGVIANIGSGAGLVNVQSQDLIRFNGRGPWYELNKVSSDWQVRLRRHVSAGDTIEDAGQTDRNTPWPAAGVNHSFEILRFPDAAGTPMPVPNRRVVDLYWSGFGPDGAAETFAKGDTRFYANLSPPKFTNVAVVFDSSGRVRKVVAPAVSGTEPVMVRKTVTGPILLLVGRADRAGQAYSSSAGSVDDSLGANWQYADSYWIGIDPMTGAVRTAACTPNAATVVASQAWIRQNLLASGG